jgi:hypothetical protein
MLLLAAAAAAQLASTGIDLFDDQLVRINAFSPSETEILIDASEFVFLQLYLVGLAISVVQTSTMRVAATEALGLGQKPAISLWLKRHGLSPKRFYDWHIAPAMWRWRHPGGTPEEYYAGMIRRQIRGGHFHPAIGRTARAVRTRTELLDILVAHGLQPAQTVVDYGCGSFRLGAAMIDYLEPGKYWGLDVVEDFMTLGLELLDPTRVAEKRPNALLINAANLARTRAAAPDFVVSWHVCSKVPPHRLQDYFGKIISLMAPTTLVLVHFPETKRRRRQSRFSWAESRESVAAVIRSIDPSLEIRFAPITDEIAGGVRQTMVIVRRPTDG